MTTERPRLPVTEELLVWHDERHSYVQRTQTHAGPGTYTLPSTFQCQRQAPNMLLRVVQRENYGRKFSRLERTMPKATASGRHLATTNDSHLDRREKLRKLLLNLGTTEHLCQDDSTSLSSHRSVSLDERAQEVPNSCIGFSSCQRTVSTKLATIDVPHDAKNLPVEGTTHKPQQSCLVRAPRTYQHFLMRTSYLERLKKHRQRALNTKIL